MPEEKPTVDHTQDTYKKNTRRNSFRQRWRKNFSVTITVSFYHVGEGAKNGPEMTKSENYIQVNGIFETTKNVRAEEVTKVRLAEFDFMSYHVAFKKPPGTKVSLQN